MNKYCLDHIPTLSRTRSHQRRLFLVVSIINIEMRDSNKKKCEETWNERLKTHISLSQKLMYDDNDINLKQTRNTINFFLFHFNSLTWLKLKIFINNSIIACCYSLHRTSCSEQNQQRANANELCKFCILKFSNTATTRLSHSFCSARSHNMLFREA